MMKFYVVYEDPVKTSMDQLKILIKFKNSICLFKFSFFYGMFANEKHWFHIEHRSITDSENY